MSRTFIRQDDQIAASNTSDGGYSDAVAPSLANYQTNPSTLLDDLNNMRSMLSYLKDIQTGNWYDAQTAPVALEAGTLRGVDDLNDALHLVEKKRVLRDVYLITDVTVPAEVKATGTLTGTVNFSDTDTVTIDTKVYTFQATLTNVDGNVQLGGSLATSLQNLYDAINLTGTPGTQYAAAMTLHPTVTATAVGATTLDVEAKLGGTQGNLIATTSSVADPDWGAATLTGGAGDLVILGTGELPTQTTAAVGTVATLGTVVAYVAGFGAVSLNNVTGSNALNPKNLLQIDSATTHDPILSGGRIIYGLLQSETVTDGHTISDTTPTRVQISFVRFNNAGTALEYAPSVDIAGRTIHYAYRERVRLEDLSEQDFLRGAVIDIPAAAAVDRQDVYDNQGTTPVETTTNSTLDLNAAGIFWELRDLLNATLFRVTEGSTGGTTTVQLGSDVDTFDVNAVVNDFSAGATLRSGGTRPIRVGVSDGVIDTSSGDLEVRGAAELFLDDGNQTGSTWAQTQGIKLSDTTAEWDAFETAFGEVSLLNAIVQAGNANLHSKVWAVLTANVAADTDVSGPSNDNNLDTDLGDLSGGDFLQDYDLYLNGVLLRPGANAGANHDYYPGTALANGQLKFEFSLKGTGTKPDQLTLVKWV